MADGTRTQHNAAAVGAAETPVIASNRVPRLFWFCGLVVLVVIALSISATMNYFETWSDVVLENLPSVVMVNAKPESDNAKALAEQIQTSTLSPTLLHTPLPTSVTASPLLPKTNSPTTPTTPAPTTGLEEPLLDVTPVPVAYASATRWNPDLVKGLPLDRATKNIFTRKLCQGEFAGACHVWNHVSLYALFQLYLFSFSTLPLFWLANSWVHIYV